MSMLKPHRRLSLTQPRSEAGRVEAPEVESAPATPVDEPILTSVATLLRDPALRRDAFLVVPLSGEGRGEQAGTEVVAAALPAPAAGVPAGRRPVVFAGAALAVAAGVVVFMGLSARSAAPARPAAAPLAAAPALPADAVAANPDGTLVLSVGKARVQGPSVRKCDGDIGYWNRKEDSVAWTVVPPAPGEYSVALAFSCGEQSGGKFSVRFADQRLTGESTSTGGWGTYRQVRLGKVTLHRPTTVLMRAEGPIHTALMSTRGLKLFPVRSTTQASAR